MYHPDSSRLFWGSDDDELESTPQDLKLKLKSESSCLKEIDLDAGESRWQDIPMELLVRILALLDSRTIIIASGICTSWRDALRFGILDLSFSWCGKNVSMLVRSIASKFTHLRSCTLRRCPALDDQAIRALASNCHDLHSLDVSNGTKLTDASLDSLANGCKKLERLDLSGCSEITESGVVLIAENCSRLKHLNLCGCLNAGTDKALMALAQNCSGIQILNVGWCERITDDGLTALANWCPDLRGLDLCGCHLITDRSVIVLADKCHRLRLLGLYCCRNITDLSMYSLINSSKYRSRANTGKRNTKGGSCSSGFTSNAPASSTGSCSTSCNGSNSSCCGSSSSIITSNRSYVQTLLSDEYGYGLVSLNLSGCTALSGPAVQAVCDTFPDLHTCQEKHSLNVSGCTNLISVHCRCVVEAQRERVKRAAPYVRPNSILRAL